MTLVGFNGRNQRLPSPLLLLSLLVALSPGACTGEPGTPQPQRTSETLSTLTAPVADHHMHIWSESAVAALLRIQEVVGQRLVDEGDGALTATEAVAALDSADIETGVVVSVAYFFSFPELEIPDAEKRMREENDWVAAQVARHPDRLVGFCAVNPLVDFAPAEVDRCAELPGIVGIKLHFANSDADLRDDDHLERLAGLFGRGDTLGLAFLVHMRTRAPDYGGVDVERFVEAVLPRAPNVPIQIAHLGGWGGFDEPTAAAVAAFARLLDEAEVDPNGRLFFDIAATAVPPERAGGDSELLAQVEEINRGVADAVRALGVERILFGSDWSAMSLPGSVSTLRTHLPLDEGERARIMGARAPYLP